MPEKDNGDEEHRSPRVLVSADTSSAVLRTNLFLLATKLFFLSGSGAGYNRDLAAAAPSPTLACHHPPTVSPSMQPTTVTTFKMVALKDEHQRLWIILSSGYHRTL